MSNRTLGLRLANIGSAILTGGCIGFAWLQLAGLVHLL